PYTTLFRSALTVGLQVIVDAFEMLPINFLDALGMVGNPVVIGFSVFPAVAIARQHSFNKGITTFVISTIVLFVVKRFGTFDISETASLTLSAEGMTLLTGMILLIYYYV